jgi:multiple antibiotic resistance protein
MFGTFLQAFIPLFVAIDVFGVLPLYVGLTERMDDISRRKLTVQSVFTAFAISLIFLVAGTVVFSFLGITESDFRVGGGIVLLVLAVYDLLFSHDVERTPEPLIGVVPIGIPLIMGPAALTTIILLVNSHGYGFTIVSLVANMLVVWLAFRYAPVVIRAIGRAGARATAKVIALFLAGIAVMMIRSGIEKMIAPH